MNAALSPARSSRRVRWPRLAAIAVTLVALGGALTLTGCYGSYGVEADYPVAVGAVPADIYGYPSYAYGGTTVYLVGDRWYYPYGGGWHAFRSEPAELGRYRASIGGYYGPGYRGYGGYRAAYPGYQGGVYRGAPAYRGGGVYRGGGAVRGGGGFRGGGGVRGGGGGGRGGGGRGGGHHR